MKSKLKASTPSYAHLLGREKTPVQATNDTKRDDETQEEFERRRDRDSASGDDLVQGDDESDEDFKKRKKEAKDDERDEGESDEDYEKRKKGNKARRTAQAARAEAGQPDDIGDDDSDEADMRDPVAGPARLRERARCSQIFADAAAAKNLPHAATLAFHTNLPRSQGVALMRNAGQAATPRKTTLDDRMSRVVIPPVGAGDSARGTDTRTKAQQDGDAVIIAGMKRRGESDSAISAFAARQAISRG